MGEVVSRTQRLPVMSAYFLGIDIGTQGVRLAVLDAEGHTLSAADKSFSLEGDIRIEQDVREWWKGCEALMEEVLKALEDRSQLVAIGVTSTSGTIVPVDAEGQPLHAALMYSDQRSSAQAERCKSMAAKYNVEGYTAFNSSSGLPKMLWFRENFPEVEVHKFIHASDFITGTLCGDFGVTDYTNALKSGYDLHHYLWPTYLFELGLSPEQLQKVVPSGQVIGTLLPCWAEKWGLSSEVKVTAGMTDGCVSQVASGAVSPGTWNTTIGTTLVIKGVSKIEIKDSSGALYNHRHPQGYWMPGGASNTGADWVSSFFSGRDLNALNEEAALLVPTGTVAWPLLQKGERFPFFSPDARGFLPEGADDGLLLAAGMEGVAYIEKMAYERIEHLSGEKVEKVYSAGGGSNSDLWMKIRASVLDLPIQKMKNTSGAAGAAILAASGTYYPNLSTAASHMVHMEKEILPERAWVEAYSVGYDKFLGELKKRAIW
jgi:sugar (pentulose or hexulose) kinase